MSSGGAQKRNAQEAARVSTELSGRYAALGAPALRGAIGYASQAVNIGLPEYADRAIDAQKTTALEGRAMGATRALSQIAPPELIGGQAIAQTGNVMSDAGTNWLDQLSKIRTSKALAGVEQRNNMLSILQGGTAAATNLAAGFGAQGIGALSQIPESPGYGLGLAALNTGLGIYGSLQKPNLPGYSNTLANVLGNHPGVGP